MERKNHVHVTYDEMIIDLVTQYMYIYGMNERDRER